MGLTSALTHHMLASPRVRSWRALLILGSRVRGNDVGLASKRSGIPRSHRFACSRPLTLREGGGFALREGERMVSLRSRGKSCGEVELLADVVGECFAVDEGGAGDVLDGESDALEEGHFLV